MSIPQLGPADSEVLNTAQCFIVFAGDDGNGEAACKAASQLPQGNPNLKFFYVTGSLGSRIKDFLGLPETEETKIAIINVPTSKHYIYSGSLTEKDISEWIQLVKDEKVPSFRKSAPRPPNDRDPDHPEIFQLTADSFDELVVNSSVEFFVDLWADWCGPCVALGPTLDLLSQVIADIPTIKIGKLNVDDNSTDKTFFPEPHIPNMKFFSNKDKKAPIKYDGKRTLTDLLSFIHTNATTKFDLEVYTARANKLESISGVLQKAKKLLSKTDLHLSRHASALPDAQKNSIETAIANLKAEIGKGADATESNLSALITSLKDNNAWSILHKEEAEYQRQEEKRALKNVSKIESDEEYEEVVKKANEEGKTVIVDCFATWCGPCVYIAPIFSALSEKYTNLCFIKIDVDQQRKTAQLLNITAMPTFKVIKDGKVVDELRGADPNGLEALCKKHN